MMKIVIVSGYFNPLHGGHLDMIEAAAQMGDKLIVIVNNDKQQLLKKGKIILDENNRLRLIDRKSTRLNSSHMRISYAVFFLKKKKRTSLVTQSLTV